MATIKAFTNISQSKKLTKILPPESSDMYIANYIGKSGEVDGTNIHYYTKGESFGAPEIILCWSLSALLSVLHYPSLHKTSTDWQCDSYNKKVNFYQFSENANNPIDACYEMIIRLHESNLL